MNNKSKLHRRSESVTRVQAPSDVGTSTTSIDRVIPIVQSTEELSSDVEYETSINHENILFVYLDVNLQPPPNLMSSLRSINTDVQIYTDTSSCLHFLRSSTDQIFFISSLTDKQLIEDFHNAKSVEAIFIFDSEVQIDSRLPKWYGVYAHFEELLIVLKTTLQWFEQTQMDIFIFERDRIFLWSQLWKEELIRLQKCKVVSSNKEKLAQMAENYYRGNIKMNNMINEFNRSYVKSDALQWCFFSRFPSVLLHRALYSHNTEHLQACRFLLIDVSRMIQSETRKSSCELYKGMKMTNELLVKLENHIGKMICSKGFLQCSQSRKIALETASSLDHRPDLLSVLLKITYDASVSIAQLHNKETSSFMVFDIYTVFRVKYVNRGSVSIIKIETADAGGAKLAREYRMKHQGENLQTLLTHLISPPKPPVKLPSPKPPLELLSPKPPLELLSPKPPVKLSSPKPPVKLSSPKPPLKLSSPKPPLKLPHPKPPIKLPPLKPAVKLAPSKRPVKLPPIKVDSSVISEDNDNEIQAQHLVERGDIDQAITIYQRLQPESARVFNIIGALYADKKGDYDSAVKYYEKALEIQEKIGEDDTRTLSHLGIAHRNRSEFDLSLSFHFRSLEKQKAMSQPNQRAIANNLTGIANAYWSRQKLTEALDYAQQALTLNESIKDGNEANTAGNLAILANIYHSSGNNGKALEIGTRALRLLESSSSPDSFVLASIINNLAAIQISEKLFTDARYSLERALEICKNSLPEGHPKRLAMENNIKCIIAIEQNNAQNSQLTS